MNFQGLLYIPGLVPGTEARNAVRARACPGLLLRNGLGPRGPRLPPRRRVGRWVVAPSVVPAVVPRASAAGALGVLADILAWFLA